MKILLLGKNGQVGWELQRSFSPLGELIALGKNETSSLCGDITNEIGITKTINLIKPTIIVNAAAYTAVDNAEKESETSFLVNAHALERLAAEALANDAWLIHYSTDYVFNGRGSTPWLESDNPDPVNMYGKGKLAGEKIIQASGCKHLIFRTSWVYGLIGNNFVKTILRLSKEKETLSIVADQIGAPTGADLLADVTAYCALQALNNPSLSGLYHLSAAGEVSWCDYAKYIVDTAIGLGHKFQIKTILPIPTADYRTLAERPLNSRLNTDKLKTNFSLTLPHWSVGVERLIKEI